MKAFLMALAALATVGLTACEQEDQVEIETPDGSLEVEEDGDVNVEEN